MTHSRRTVLGRTSLAGAAIVSAMHTVGAVGAADADDAEIVGTVTDFGVPVADATVTVDGDTTTTTDDDGSYSTSLEPGSYAVLVTAAGYDEARTSVVVEPGTTATADVQLDPAWGPGMGDLEVFATPVGGGPTVPSYVTIYGDEEYGIFLPRGAIPDDRSWDRGFLVSEGWWEVRVSSADGYSDGYERIYVEEGETVLAWVELPEGEETISGPGTLNGRIVDNTDEPIDDATLTVDGERIPIDDDGGFERDVDHGRHEVAVTATGYYGKQGVVDVRFARTTNVLVRLDPEQ